MKRSSRLRKNIRRRCCKRNSKIPLCSIKWIKILFGGAGRDAATLKALVGNSVGIHSMQTSVFGGIVVGAITA